MASQQLKHSKLFMMSFTTRSQVGYTKTPSSLLPVGCMGYDTMAKNDWRRISQLAILMEEVELDSIIMQWASLQFGGIKHTAALQDAAENLAASLEELSFHCDQDESKSDTKDPD